MAPIASAIYAMLLLEFGPVSCISVHFEKGIMKLTLLNLLENDIAGVL